MKITNNMKLPQPFVDAVNSDYQYREKRYSVTTLLKPTREIMLQRRHNDEIEQDVSDMIWSIFGTAVHSVLENSTEGKHLLKEKSLEIKVGDYTLSGRSDLYNTHSFTVIDYKVRLNGKVERSHRSDQEGFYNTLTFKTYAELKKKMLQWNIRYNNRPHASLKNREGKKVWWTPLEKRADLLNLLKEKKEEFEVVRFIKIQRTIKQVYAVA